jgi:hypothetical protein
MLTFLAMFLSTGLVATEMPVIKAAFSTHEECLAAVRELHAAKELQTPEVLRSGVHFMCLSVQYTTT